jgi:hypothetical protein
MKKYYLEIFVLGLVALVLAVAVFKPTVDRKMKLIHAIYKQAGYGY